MHTISVVGDKPVDGEDPLGLFLQDADTRLRAIGIDPDDPAQVDRRGKQLINFHYPDGTTGVRLSVILDAFRGKFHYCSGTLMPDESSALPADVL